MNKRPLLRRAVRRALLTSLVVSSTGFAYAASAQDAVPQGNSAQSTIDEITVTGSRLRRSRDFVDVSPVQTVDFEQIQAAGNLTLESTLNKFPQLAPDTTSATNQSGGSGVLSANLRGAGASRTLVLVDGRRFVPADGTGLVDLATIPDILVERIEIVTGGASSVYGSDAIAGAVNFVMRDSFEGVELRYQYGQSSKGDGAGHKIDMLMGARTSDGAGSVMLHAGYTTRDPVFMGDREFSSQPLLADSQGVLQPFGVASIPAGFVGIQPALFPQIQGVDLAGAQANCPGGAIQGLRFEPDGTPQPFCRPTDQYNYAAPNYLLRPLDRLQLSALGSYDLSDNVEAYAQAFYVKKENAFQQAPLNIAPTTPGMPSGTLLIPNADTNPLFQPALRDFFAQNTAFFDPDGDGIYRVNAVARRFNEFGPRNVSFVADAMNVATGLRGDFELAARTWGWDAFYQYGRSDLTQTNVGLLSNSRLSAGLDVVLVNGQPQCRVNLLGCVPLNIFGEGSLTPQMVNYIRTSSTRVSQFTREVAGATATGDLFDLPAGPVAVAVGSEWRREAFKSVPDGVATSGDLGGTPAVITGGDYNIVELFAETRVPIVEGLPGVQSLAIEAAARYADYSTIGSVVAWSGSLDWEITNSVRARAGLSRAIRAPNLDELFRPVSAGFRGGTDPCVASNNPTEAQKALCVAQGVPANVIDTLTNPASQGFGVETGGNLDLTEESADTLTLGLVLTPERLPGLSVAIDYYKIELDDAIAEVAFQALVNSCFQTLNVNSVECQSITRLPTGNIDFVRAPLLNVAERTVEGLDVQMNYALDSAPGWLSLPGRAATLDFAVIGSWQFENSTIPFAGQASTDCAGRYGGSCSSDSIRLAPGFRALLRTNWRTGPLRVTPEVRYIGKLKLSPTAFPNENNTVGSWVYFDLTAGYEVNDRIQVYGGMTNVFDKQPPVLGFRAGGDSNTNVQLYDTIGRSFFLGASVGFGPR